jgi:hypothetical protein
MTAFNQQWLDEHYPDGVKRRQLVADLRAEGNTFAEIGTALGVSASRARELYESYKSRRRHEEIVFTPHDPEVEKLRRDKYIWQLKSAIDSGDCCLCEDRELQNQLLEIARKLDPTLSAFHEPHESEEQE